MRHANKDLKRWRNPHLAKQFVTASRLVPFLSVTICRADASESDKTCQGASQSLSPSNGRTCLRLQHLYQIWQFLKLCLYLRASRRRGDGDFTKTRYKDLQTKSPGDIPHEAPSGSCTYCTCFHRRLAVAGFSIYAIYPGHPPTHCNL